MAEESWRPNCNISVHPTTSNCMPQSQQTQHQQNYDEQNLLDQISNLRKQIDESLANLKAQENALNSNSTKQAKIEALCKLKDDKRINDIVKQVGLNLSGFERFVDHMQTSGSKETIQNSKKWIFDNCNTDKSREVVLVYLLSRIKNKSASTSFKLHVLYLINDWAHYCERKKLDSVKRLLMQYVPKLYAWSYNSVQNDPSFHEKLEKLLAVWETHKYFDDDCFKSMRESNCIYENEKFEMAAEYKKAVDELELDINNTLHAYERQHKEYEKHILAQINAIEDQIRSRKGPELKTIQVDCNSNDNPEFETRRRSRFDKPPLQKIPSLLDASIQLPTFFSSPQPQASLPTSHQDVFPECPYYELPAGMMVPLVKIDDITFKPLHEKDLRIPSPTPPSEFLLQEVERFYSCSMLTDATGLIENDGWEPNSLLDHYLRKAEHKVKLETKLKIEGKRFEDIITNRYVANSKRSTSSSSSSSSSSSDSDSDSSSSQSTGHKRSRSRSRSASPEDRPSFRSEGEFSITVETTFAKLVHFKMPTAPSSREQNKGAQLMARMGWEGGKLGTNDQGLEEPIEAGQPRDKIDQYRGLGSKEDMYDNYRKQMSIKKTGRF